MGKWQSVQSGYAYRLLAMVFLLISADIVAQQCTVTVVDRDSKSGLTQTTIINPTLTVQPVQPAISKAQQVAPEAQQVQQVAIATTNSGDVIYTKVY